MGDPAGLSTETGKRNPGRIGTLWAGGIKLGWWSSSELGLREGSSLVPRYRLSPDTC